MAPSGIPWRGPGDGRPDLPLPPGPMPLRRDGNLRKRWRYVGFYGETLMLCATRAEVGPTGSSFWVVWDRERGRELARNTLRPGSREVVLDGPRLLIDSPGLHADLRLGESDADRIDLPRRERLGLDPQARRRADRGHGRDPGSTPHGRRLGRRRRIGRLPGPPHQLALVGRRRHRRRRPRRRLEPGRGHQRPAANSERAVWVDGVPHEPAPVTFDGLDAIRLRRRLPPRLRAGAERARDDNFLLIRSTYRHRFGTFTGALDGIDLAEARGVMESHTALW